MTDQEYDDYLDTLLAALAKGEIMSPDQLAARMHPGHRLNQKVFAALLHTKVRGITALQLEKALDRRQREADAEALAAHYREQTKELLGCQIKTQREMVAAFIARNYTANYACEFTDVDGNLKPRGDLLHDIQLTAADLRLTKKPLELKDRNFERALDEWCRAYRKRRVAQVLAVIENLSLDRDRVQVEREMMELCMWFFREPAYAMASIQTVIWMVKRRMLNIPIAEPLMTVLYGKQRGGKWTFWVIADLCKGPVDVTALVADSTMDLYLYHLGDCDELSKAGSTDLNKLKTTLTSKKISRRVYYTQTFADVPMLAICIGTSNVPVSTMIRDATGMRRFNQLDVKSRKAIEPHWAAIVNDDWLGFWQSVDARGACPLEPFFDQLSDKQEKMRTVDRVETWLNHYDHNSKTTPPLSGLCSSTPSSCSTCSRRSRRAPSPAATR